MRLQKQEKKKSTERNWICNKSFKNCNENKRILQIFTRKKTEISLKTEVVSCWFEKSTIALIKLKLSQVRWACYYGRISRIWEMTPWPLFIFWLESYSSLVGWKFRIFWGKGGFFFSPDPSYNHQIFPRGHPDWVHIEFHWALFQPMFIASFHGNSQLLAVFSQCHLSFLLQYLNLFPVTC